MWKAGGACELGAVKRKMLRAIQGKMLCSLVLALRQGSEPVAVTYQPPPLLHTMHTLWGSTDLGGPRYLLEITLSGSDRIRNDKGESCSPKITTYGAECFVACILASSPGRTVTAHLTGMDSEHRG